jgi:hypothetical protein
VRHPFLAAVAGFVVLLTALIVVPRFTPACSRWRAAVERRTDDLMYALYGPPTVEVAGRLYQQTNGTQTYRNIRRDIEWRAERELAGDRPALCF